MTAGLFSAFIILNMHFILLHGTIGYIVSSIDMIMKFFWGRGFHKTILLRTWEMLPTFQGTEMSFIPQIFIKTLIYARQYDSSGGWIVND